MEAAKDQEVLDWAEAEEQKELEEMKRAAEASSKSDPTQDLANVKWMSEQLEAMKKLYGDSFGEDIEEEFDEE
jgi:hypothetical protein